MDPYPNSNDTTHNRTDQCPLVGVTGDRASGGSLYGTEGSAYDSDLNSFQGKGYSRTAPAYVEVIGVLSGIEGW